MYDKIKQSLFYLSNRTYKTLTPPEVYEAKLKEYNSTYHSTLPEVISLYPYYKLKMPTAQEKYTKALTTIHAMDDRIQELGKDLSLEIKKTAVTMKEEDKELDHLQGIYTNLENYMKGVEDLDNTSSQMLQDYQLIYKQQRISFWVYVVILLGLSYLCIGRSSTKKQSCILLAIVMVILYLLRYAYQKWVESTWFPPGSTITQPTTTEDTPEIMQEVKESCNTAECCGTGTAWNDTMKQCELASF